MGTSPWAVSHASHWRIARSKREAAQAVPVPRRRPYSTLLSFSCVPRVYTDFHGVNIKAYPNRMRGGMLVKTPNCREAVRGAGLRIAPADAGTPLPSSPRRGATALACSTRNPWRGRWPSSRPCPPACMSAWTTAWQSQGKLPRGSPTRASPCCRIASCSWPMRRSTTM